MSLAPARLMAWRTPAVLCAGRVIHDDHVADLQGRHQHLFDVSKEDITIIVPS